MGIIKRIRTGIFWRKTAEIIELQSRILQDDEIILNYAEQIKELKNTVSLKNKEISDLKSTIRELKKENKKLAENQKQEGEYLVRKLPSGRPKKKVQEMNVKYGRYSSATKKQLKELEEIRG